MFCLCLVTVVLMVERMGAMLWVVGNSVHCFSRRPAGTPAEAGGGGDDAQDVRVDVEGAGERRRL